MTSARFLLLPVLAAFALVCEASTPTVDGSPAAEVSFDGLHRVKHSKADTVWAVTDLDLTGYDKIMLQGAGIEYRHVKAPSRTSFRPDKRSGPQPMTEEQKARFKQLVFNVFVEELRKSKRFTFADEPGPDVLLIRGGLLDVVSYVPTDSLGSVDFFLSEVGEATLVLEIRDSVSEAILARAVDRRTAETSGRLMKSTQANNAIEVERVVRQWGSTLRKRLDKLAGS